MKTEKTSVSTFYEEGELVAILIRDNVRRRNILYKTVLMDQDEIADLVEGKVNKKEDDNNSNTG